jgi:hypothetical protein
MHVEIVLSCKGLASMTLAAEMWTIELLSRTAMFFVYLPFVSRETTRVGLSRTLVWSSTASKIRSYLHSDLRPKSFTSLVQPGQLQ